jgi:hypothetical protein
VGARYSAAVRVLLICTLVLLTGCARGPTLPEAAGRLESDSHSVLHEGARRLGARGARPEILFDRRRACPGGRARQVWRGTVPLRRGPGARVDLDHATDVSIGLARARGYRLQGPPAFARQFRAFTMTRDGSDVRIAVQLHGGRHSSMRVDSATPCLPRT